MTKKNKEYLIKNIKCFENLVIYNNHLESFELCHKKDINLSITTEKIAKYQIKHIIGNKYELKVKDVMLGKSLKVYLIFSSNYIDNPLFFNIIIKEGKKYKILNISYNDFGNDIITCSEDEKLYFEDLDVRNLMNINFNDDPKYIFYFSNPTHEICKIKIDNNEYSLYGYNKSPVINGKGEKKNQYCYFNPELRGSWKVNTLENPSCNHIILNKKNKNNIFNELSLCAKNNPYRLLRKLSKEERVLSDYKDNIKGIRAGIVTDKINSNSESINSKIGDVETQEKFEEVEGLLDGPYKVVLGNTLNNFNNYLKEGKFSNIQQAQRQYKAVLNTIKDRHAEYSLARKFGICNGAPFKQMYDVSNVIDCQSHCNANENCKNISYNEKNKTCNLYESCRVLFNRNYDTYTKKSLLRAEGYNLFDAFYRQMSPSIDAMPVFPKLILYLAAFLMIACLSLLIFRFLKIFIKLILCSYYGSCDVPTELFDFERNILGLLDKRYI